MTGDDILKRILVCEDEDPIREFVVINLRRAGYEVVDVNCGESALKDSSMMIERKDLVYSIHIRRYSWECGGILY